MAVAALLGLALVLGVPGVVAEELAAEAVPKKAAPKWYETVQFDGFVDVYYAWNDNHPRSHANFIPGTGTTAKRANELGLNLATVEFMMDPEPIGFHLSLVAGNGTEVVHAAEPASASTGPDVFRNIYEASLSYRAPVGSGLLITAGTYPSHIGFEAFFSKDNWLYTRSWLGELSPYYQTGIKVAYTWNDRWSWQAHALNGWQTIADNNDGKSLGTQFAYSGERLSASFNTLIGPELANDDDSLRMLGDLVGIYKATPSLSFGASVDRGRQELPDADAADWLGIAGYGRYELNGKHALALRAEQFRDPDNGISGFSQTLAEGTLTYVIGPFRASS